MRRSPWSGLGPALWAALATLLLLAGAPLVAFAATGPGGPQSPRVLAAQDAYPLPPDAVATLDPYVGPTEPGLPAATATPASAQTSTRRPEPGVTLPTPLYPTITPTGGAAEGTPAATATRTRPAFPTREEDGSPTLRIRTITPIPTEGEQPLGPEETATPTTTAASPAEPTADRAAMLIATAVAREEATLAAPPAAEEQESGPQYGGFVGVVVLLLAGIGYALLLRRQREGDRQTLLQGGPEDE